MIHSPRVHSTLQPYTHTAIDEKKEKETFTNHLPTNLHGEEHPTHRYSSSREGGSSASASPGESHLSFRRETVMAKWSFGTF